MIIFVCSFVMKHLKSPATYNAKCAYSQTDEPLYLVGVFLL